MNIKRIYTVVMLLCASLLLSFTLNAGQKDVIMVLDTSLSMVGQGTSGKNIMKAVKRDIKNFIYNDIKDGDRLTFLTFDSKVIEYPTIKIDDENDRNIATKFLLRIEPKGLWTHTKLMIDRVIKKAKELEETGKDRQPVIIILTDALDDPPPGKKGERLSLKNLLKDIAKNPKYWVYYVNFGKFQAAVDEKVADSKNNLKIINVDKKSGKSVVTNVISSDIKEKEKSDKSSLIIILIVLAAVLVGLAIGALLKRKSSQKVSGTLEYWNNDLLDPAVDTIDLTGQLSSKITIGNNVSAVINLRDMVASSVLIFTAEFISGEVKIKLQAGDGEAISFKNRGEGSFLENGDIFVYGNYSFKYLN